MYTDVELIQLARQGNATAEEELAARYGKLVRICARPYFLVGGDSEDLIQEGMLGLLSAIRRYEPTGGTSFKTYAEQCIRNRLISAVESASRFKHAPLNNGVSFEDVMGNVCSGQDSYDDTFSRQTEESVLAREWEKELFTEQSKLLSKLEREVLGMYLDGMSYKEIADQLNKPVKSVDNAVQRIRKKIAQIH